MSGLLMRNAVERLTKPLNWMNVMQKSSSNVMGQHSRNVHTPRKRLSVYETGGPKVRGMELLRDPFLNKGMGFTLKERQMLGIHGLLPPAVFTQEEQAVRILANFRRCSTDLDKFIYLTALHDRNEKLFYYVVSENIEEMAPIIYTPTVGLACQNFGFIFRRPRNPHLVWPDKMWIPDYSEDFISVFCCVTRGVFLTINDAGHIAELLCNWPESNVKAVVVTDGERILGLGDLGAFGMGIPIGKLSLYTAMGGVPPQQCLPVLLDVGTDNEKLLDNPMYIGLRHKRIRGPRYDDLIDEFMEAVTMRYGQDTLVQFEDFANNNAFRLLEKYRNKYLTFNDDIQGTASVAVAGIIAAMRVVKSRLSDHKYLFQGAGEASIGIADLLVAAMVEEGISKQEAVSKIWMVDSKGLVTKNRASGGITEHKAVYAKEHKDIRSLEEICAEIKPTAAIGAAAVSGAFTDKFLKLMADNNERPIIFALSNPTSKAECTAEQAYRITEGRCVFASGSPFDPVEIGGKTLYPGQGNNAYIFPGVALGAIAAGTRHVTDGMFLKASQALASMVTDADLAQGRVYPPLNNIFEVSTKLATGIVTYAYEQGLAGTYPEPVDKEEFVKQHQFSPLYESFIPHTYAWPGTR